MKDKCMYSWEENKTQGMKMCFEKDPWEQDNPQYKEQANVEYICLPALVDDGKFVPPANINFMDLSQLEQQGASN